MVKIAEGGASEGGNSRRWKQQKVETAKDGNSRR